MNPYFSISKKKHVVLAALLLATGHLGGPTLAGADTLADAVHRGDKAHVRSLLENEPDLSEGDADGNTALHWAALNGDAALVRELLKRGTPVNATNRVGATPLLYSVGNLDAVRALVEAGAEVNQASRFMSTPLIAATRYPESSAVVRLLLSRGADPRMKDGAGNTPLDNAAYAGDLETVNLLMAAGLTPKAVIQPARMGHRQIVKAALEAGADLKTNGKFTGHALNAALYGQQPEIAKLLIEKGADLNFRSPRGQPETPPHTLGRL
ncbi:MAG: ankyrin repeat domain-containing protein [Proteobacteria bacterium]|nr:ankyrin repeat domain-containing protein [Pseudomonadota bacterium]